MVPPNVLTNTSPNLPPRANHYYTTVIEQEKIRPILIPKNSNLVPSIFPFFKEEDYDFYYYF